MSMLRITQLELQQIGPFGDLTLNFPEKPAGMEAKAEIHILTGENGTGKSTLLEVLAQCVSSKDLKIQRKWRKKPRIKASFNQIEETELLISEGNHYNLKSYSIFFERKYWFPYLDLSRPFGIAFFAYSGQRHFDHVSITGIKEIESHPFEHALDFRQSVNPGNILQWVANNIAGSFIAQGRGETQQAENFRRSVQKLEKAISDIIQKEIQSFKKRGRGKALALQVGIACICFVIYRQKREPGRIASTAFKRP
jgi:energy-coupling factor transporter ATP-binding protein EcfA2